MRHNTAPTAPFLKSFRHTIALLLTGISLTLWAGHTEEPSSVTVAGDLQSELGCPGDWQPDCAATHLAYDAEDDVWQETFTVPAGNWQYKAPLNDAWDENYGLGAVPNGANIPLSLGADTDVKFYYDHETHWITDDINSVIATVPGSFQSELGCAGDWDPSCLRSWLQDPDGDTIFMFETKGLPAGDYEAKVAHDESWDLNFGAGGVQNGPNIPFNVPASCTAMRFEYNLASHVLGVSQAPPPPQPVSVTIPGNLQDELGCPGDWDPSCSVTFLAFDAEDEVWQGTFPVPAGSWEYKAALNGSWDENYGANATRDGPNIGLTLGDLTDVKFYYDHETHWVVDNVNTGIPTAVGSFQSELGCSGDWDPSCLRSWLQDPDGDGIFTMSARLPAGAYEAKVAINESWDLNYGDGGVQNGANIPFTVPSDCTEMFFTYSSATNVLEIGAGPGGPKGNLNQAKSFWVAEDTIAAHMGEAGDTFALHYATVGGLGIDSDGITGADGSIPLTLDPAGLPAAVTGKFPHLAGLAALKIDESDLPLVPMILKSQSALSIATGDGTPLDATSLQTPGVLDDLYTYDGDLGPVFNGGVPTISLWAPTAKAVTLHLYDDSDPAAAPTMSVPMVEDAATGVWTCVGDASWNGLFYLYEVEVYVPSTGQVEHNLVTDPYSLSLSTNSLRSQIVNLDDGDLKPAGWDSLVKPPLAAPEDIVIYELHVRDFSANDPSVPDEMKGTYKAFTLDGSNGTLHLGALAASGLTHVHLLPVFDIATINEKRGEWQSPDPAVLETHAPDSDQQQAAVTALEELDGFNWGYDPWHYTTPEGSYATDPDGAARVVEFRDMVRGLSDIGLRVVMDVVYNHTNSAGQDDKSVLDKIVPGYYHRLNDRGAVETSTCCQNTATEHNMMEKLMVDSLVTWAREYKVDAFRFDLMGHHSKANLAKVRAALDELTIAQDGVDGSAIYLYGEGWNFGEVANNARFVQATQANMAGTGVGSFNDRIRDGVRGGGPFSGLQEQGFATGLYYDPNSIPQSDTYEELLRRTDWIRVALTGNLANYELEDRNGSVVPGSAVDYQGQPAGYTLDPQEIINYASAHDNETLFDAVQLKLPVGSSMADRVRAHNMGLSVIALGQGVPFFHAGSDMLRSKSMDRDSYNSGDWFNRLDFTYQDNNWGVGLPVASKNQDNWGIMQPLLANPALDPDPPAIRAAVDHFQEMLRIRRSSAMFRLPTESEVRDRLAFHNTGVGQMPGLVVMSLVDGAATIDPTFESLVVLFNANDEAVSFVGVEFTGSALALHPVQTASTDTLVRTATFDVTTGRFDVPGRTTAVFALLRDPLARIPALVDAIEVLRAYGTLNEGQANALIVKLEHVQVRIANGKPRPAANQLNAFINQVEAFVAAGILTAEEGASLIAIAETILGSLG